MSQAKTPKRWRITCAMEFTSRDREAIALRLGLKNGAQVTAKKLQQFMRDTVDRELQDADVDLQRLVERIETDRATRPRGRGRPRKWPWERSDALNAELGRTP